MKKNVNNHPIKLTHQQKVDWFVNCINERLKVKNIESEQDLIDLVKFLRSTFKQLYLRDVPGSFITMVLSKFGINWNHSKKSLDKKRFMFKLMDENESFRFNKTQLRKAVEHQFKEKILGIVFDQFWDEYHLTDEHPEPIVNIDIYGQKSLFE